MKSGLKLLFKIVAILLAVSTVIFSIAIFRYEIEEFFEHLWDRCSGDKRKSIQDDEYADFADV